MKVLTLGGVLLSALFLANSATAGSTLLTCKELKTAYDADLMNEAPYACGKDAKCNERQLSQLKKTIAFFNDEADLKQSREALESEFQPIYGKVLVGDVGMESVNIDLGDNSFILYFEAGTTKETGISNSDGTLYVGSDYCSDVEFEPVLNSSRVHALCRLIAPEVRKQGVSKFDHLDCTDGRVEEGGRKKMDFRVEKFSKTSVEVSVTRNLADFDAGYFSCKAKLKRKTNAISEFSCKVKK